MMRRLHFIIFLLAFTLILSSTGCGTTTSPTDTEDSLPTSTTSPAIADPITTPTAEPTETSTTEPTETPTTEPVLYADTIFINGQVVTMEPGVPQAEALAVLGTDILAVGNNDDIQPYIGAETEVINLDGKALLPGFIDPHTHLFNATYRIGGSLQSAQQIGLSQGITALGNLYTNPPFLQHIQEFEQQGNLDIRTSL